MSGLGRRTFARDYRECLAMADAEKARRRASRARAMADRGLVELLAEESRRRGFAGDIDWPEYFRNADIHGA